MKNKKENILDKCYYSNIRYEMVKFIPTDVEKVLEIGCAEGNFCSLLKNKYNAEVWGIELCVIPANEAKTKMDNVFIGNFENTEFELPEKYFDCIVFNDVLEHFNYPENVLKKSKNIYLQKVLSLLLSLM